MEYWERDFEWLKVRHIVKDAMKKDALPDLQTVLFLIGVQELGRIPKTKFTKEEKRDSHRTVVEKGKSICSKFKWKIFRQN